MADQKSQKKKEQRAIKVRDEGETGIFMNEGEIVIKAKKDSYIAINKDGVYLRGGLSKVAMGGDERSAGLFLKMPDFVSLLPSTIVTPIPKELPIPPLGGIGKIVAIAALFTGLAAIMR